MRPPASTIAAQQVRFTSETLSGSPELIQSAEIRTDRMSGKSVLGGLTVGGDTSFELSRGNDTDWLFAAAMMSEWTEAVVSSGLTFDLTPDPGDDQKAVMVTTGDWTDMDGNGNGVAVGDLLTFIPSGETEPVEVSVLEISSLTAIEVATKRGQEAITSAAMVAVVPPWVEIGSEQFSATLSKSYQDITHGGPDDEHGQTYTGMLVNGFTLDAAYGAMVTGSFTMVGAGYNQDLPSYQQDIVNDPSGVVNPAGTEQPVNASIDAGLVTVDGEATDFCIGSLNITLTNNLNPQNCLGKPAPTGFTAGTAEINVSMEVYASDTSYDKFMPNKLNLAPVGLMMVLRSNDGGFAFSFSALQLSFDDPSSTGQNTDVMMSMSGNAVVGDGGVSAMRIYKLD